MVNDDRDDKPTDREISDRMDKALRRMMTTPKPGTIMKRKERPATKGRVRKGRSRA